MFALAGKRVCQNHNVIHIMSSALPIQHVGGCFIWNCPSRPSPQAFFSHSFPRGRGIGKCVVTRSEVREWASAYSVWSSTPIASTILSYPPANSWWSNIHIQDYSWCFRITLAFKIHQQRCFTGRRQFASCNRTVPFRFKLPAEIVKVWSVKLFKTLLNANWPFLFPEVPI